MASYVDIIARHRAGEAAPKKPRAKRSTAVLVAVKERARRRGKRNPINPIVATLLTSAVSGYGSAKGAQLAARKKDAKKNPQRRVKAKRTLTSRARGGFTEGTARGPRRNGLRARTARKRAVGSSQALRGETSMAGKRRRQTKAQRAASLRNLAKARRARRAGGRRPAAHKRRPARRPAARRAAPRRRAPRAVSAPHGTGMQAAERRRGRRRRAAREKLANGRIRVRRSRVSIRKRNVPTRSYTKHYTRRAYMRGPWTYLPGHPRKRRKSRSREMGAHENPGPMAYENPMTGAEFIVVGITGVFGFGLGSLADRFLATHAQTDTAKTSTGGYEIYTDAPPAGALYNSEAPLAPMNLMRWGVGLGVPIVLGVGSHFIGGPWAKTVMQGAAVGWGLRTVGKGLDDMLGSLLKKTGLGQRLYGSEIMIANAITAVAALPANPAATPATVAGQLPAASTAGVGGTLGLSGVGVGGCACGSYSSSVQAPSSYSPVSPPPVDSWGQPMNPPATPIPVLAPVPVRTPHQAPAPIVSTRASSSAAPVTSAPVPGSLGIKGAPTSPYARFAGRGQAEGESTAWRSHLIAS
jgi:hypothetical protein